jgi:hypothetical protein
MVRIAAVFTLALWCPACGKASSSSPQTAQNVTAARLAGAWEGTGNQTIGFVSETGVFRISWRTRDGQGAGGGAFRLTLRSAISGRPIRVIADQAGAGGGTVDFVDDPRLYEFLVDSTNVEWSIRVEE